MTKRPNRAAQRQWRSDATSGRRGNHIKMHSHTHTHKHICMYMQACCGMPKTQCHNKINPYNFKCLAINIYAQLLVVAATVPQTEEVQATTKATITATTAVIMAATRIAAAKISTTTTKNHSSNNNNSSKNINSNNNNSITFVHPARTVHLKQIT